MSGIIPPRLLYAFMPWTGTSLPLHLSQAEGSRKRNAEEVIAY
jgi:hypothetical protein